MISIWIEMGVSFLFGVCQPDIRQIKPYILPDTLLIDWWLIDWFQAGIFYVTVFLVIGTSALFFAVDCPYLAMEITPGRLVSRIV